MNRNEMIVLLLIVIVVVWLWCINTSKKLNKQQQQYEIASIVILSQQEQQQEIPIIIQEPDYTDQVSQSESVFAFSLSQPREPTFGTTYYKIPDKESSFIIDYQPASDIEYVFE